MFGSYAAGGAVTAESDVARVVLSAATDTSERLRFAAGPDAVALAGTAA